MSSKPTVLVVDDEPAITELVGMALRYEGFAVVTAHTGRAALAAAQARPLALIVLDVMLPDVDGLHVCRQLRASSETPIIFLTARDALEDRLAGLTVGGDDYLPKPFSIEELVARIRAVLRRTTKDENATLGFADLVIDEDRHEVHRAGTLIELTPTEFNVLRYLVHNAGRVLSKAQILGHVWQYDFGGNDNVVEAYISYLRKKVDCFDPPLIHTVRGVGYSMRLPRGAQ
ncbi:MAG: response regulator transcription factor [Corynebacteriales bacterium]|nr:response regulator transcription factor [Mycobacteriales bacterium]